MDNICYGCFREKTGGGQCPYCGYDREADREKYPQALPCDTILAGRYILGKVLGQGGFGITYLGQDYKTGELVAIKEFFPEPMAARTGSGTVAAYTGERGSGFQYGKECFLQEARTLAEFKGNDNIVRVHYFFEKNGTAYFVMDYVDGVDLQRYVKDRGGRLPWRKAVDLMLPVLYALAAVHEKGIVHRDVTPDNIFITSGGTVKLLDFGAARYSAGDRSQSLDVVLKHGFAPKEQYTRHGKQGPFTDVYSTAATLYYIITGRIPPDSIDRIDGDDLPAPSALGITVPKSVEDVIFRGLEVQPADRYRTMDEFADALREAMKEPAAPTPAIRSRVAAFLKKLPRWSYPAAGVALLALVLIIALPSPSPAREQNTDDGERDTAISSDGSNTDLGAEADSGESGGPDSTGGSGDDSGNVLTGGITLTPGEESTVKKVSVPVKETDYQENDNVDSTVFYTNNEYGQCVKKVIQDNSDSWTYEYTYNQDGKLSQEKEVRGDGTVIDTVIYEYDVRGNITREDHYWNDRGLEQSFTYTYVYDSGGRVLKEEDTRIIPSEEYTERTVIVNTYDSSGNMLTTLTTSDDFNFFEENEYDSKGRKVSAASYDDNEFNSRCTYEYDDAGNILCTVSYNEDGSVQSTTSSTYDINGHELTSETHLGNGELRSWKSAVYDSDGRKLIEYEYRTSDDSMNEQCRQEIEAVLPILFDRPYSTKLNIDHEPDYWTVYSYNDEGDLIRRQHYGYDPYMSMASDTEYGVIEVRSS